MLKLLVILFINLKKITEELMPIVRHPRRFWNFCMLEDEKKEIEPIFTE